MANKEEPVAVVIVSLGIHHSGNFFYQKSTITAIEANNDKYCLQKRIENFSLCRNQSKIYIAGICDRKYRIYRIHSLHDAMIYLTHF